MNNDEQRIDFVICGTQKGGTTALHDMLQAHPDVAMASTKEAHFFDDDARFCDARPTYDDYHALFPWDDARHLRGEATPIYMYWEPSPRRMMEYNPGLRLIVMLRNPIERAYSHWNMEKNRQAEHLSFADALEAEPSRLRKAAGGQHRVFSYVDRGRYAQQLERLGASVSREQVLVLKSESFRADPQNGFEEVCRFLGLRRMVARTPINSNAGHYDSLIGRHEESFLRDVFADDVHQVEKLLGWDCCDWLGVGP